MLISYAAAALGEDGRPRGFAHLDFAEGSAVKKAVALSGQDFMGRDIFVDVAGGRPRRDSNFGTPGGRQQGKPPWFLLLQ